jgi:hypothetical protein
LKGKIKSFVTGRIDEKLSDRITIPSIRFNKYWC